jgi:hypothetical protein
MRLRHVLPALLFALPAAAEDLPIRAVTLSNAGLAQVERAGTLAPDAALSFRVPVEDVDDVLKSLLVRDPSGTVEGVRLPARDLAAEAFRGLPLRPDDFANRIALLRALRGQSVEAGGVTGRLVDADDIQGGPPDARTTLLRLALVTTEGLRTVTLREGDGVRLTDPDLAARVRRAAEALAAASTADTRLVEIRLSGATAPREVSVGYVAAAPLWKPSWRLVIPPGEGEARLQGWAVVENRSGADWDGVRLALVSGNPAAFAQALYAPIRVQRPRLPVRVAESVQVRPDTGAVPPPPPAAAPRAAGSALVLSAPSPARQVEAEQAPRFTDSIAAQPPALPASAAGRVAFTLPAPVTVRTGETANLPFLDATLPAERLWWVQDLNARNPLSAVRLRNSTGHTLPDGLATVYGGEGAEAGAYLGDAEIRAVAPEETRLIAFARDRDVRMSSATSNSERPIGVETRRGGVVLRVERREESALAVDPHAAAEAGRGARLVVDLARRPGFTPRFEVAAEGDFGLRHETVLQGGPATLRFAWEREMRTEMPVWDAGLGDPILLRWREIDVEASLRRLPGGPGTLENLRSVLERLPADAPGREKLAGIVERLAALRGQLDAARNAIRAYRTAEAVLGRARAAAEDRTGPEREDARRRLNTASIAAERAGNAADTAWDGWAKAAQDLLARMD